MKEIRRTIQLTTQRLRPVFAACALAGLWALSARAADVKPTDAKPVVDPSADKLLKRMGDYLAQAPFFSVNAEVWQDAQLGSGQQIQVGRTIDLQVRRPDRFQRLQALGFPFRVLSDLRPTPGPTWEARLAELRAFHQRTGHWPGD